MTLCFNQLTYPDFSYTRRLTRICVHPSTSRVLGLTSSQQPLDMMAVWRCRYVRRRDDDHDDMRRRRKLECAVSQAVQRQDVTSRKVRTQESRKAELTYGGTIKGHGIQPAIGSPHSPLKSDV